MERKNKPSVHVTAKAVEASIVRKSWKKIGGGVFYLGSRVIKPGQVFTASESEIPLAFRDVIVQVGGHTLDENEPIMNINKSEYKVVPSEDEEGLFNIVDSKGKKINEVALSARDANSFKRDLEA